jgi:glutamyl-tRNA reductase
MTLLACGINHLTAPLYLREQVAFSPDRAKSALKELMQLSVVKEAMILSTCNRVEIYTDTLDSKEIHNWLASTLKPPINPYWYFHEEQQAVSHIMRVASGLDSMILGEPQILGQMKQAYSLAKEVGTIGSQLQRLFQRVFNVSKQVRTDTRIGTNPITLGFAAVTLAKRIFSDLSKKSALLIGAGEIMELTALHLHNQGIKRFIIANRSAMRAKQLAEKVYGHWISISDVPLYLRESDIVVTATSSELPLLSKEIVGQAIKVRKHRPIFMIDLAVPRNIEPKVASLEDVYLYNINDLKRIVDENQKCKESAAKEAESIIELEAKHYIRDLQSLDANRLITCFRNNLARVVNNEIEPVLGKLKQGVDPQIALAQLVHNLINKISHTPCSKMKQAAYDGRKDLLIVARQLFDLDSE